MRIVNEAHRETERPSKSFISMALLRPITKYCCALFKLLSRKLVLYLINSTLDENLWNYLSIDRPKKGRTIHEPTANNDNDALF